MSRHAAHRGMIVGLEEGRQGNRSTTFPSSSPKVTDEWNEENNRDKSIVFNLGSALF